MALRLNPNAKLESLFTAARQARLPYERDAWLNLAFFLGAQYSEWNADIGSIREIPRERGMENAPRPVVNKIMHFVRTAHHDALQDKPTGDVLPPTDDYQDISDSLVARAWIEHTSAEAVTDYDGQLSRAALWAVIAGSGYLKWAWDDAADQPLILPPSFFDIYLDPYARHFTQCRYAIHSQFMDVEQVYEMYGKEVQPNAVSKADTAKTELLRGMGAAPVLEGVAVNELWQKPSRRHPEGVYAVWTGREQLVPPGPLPYPHLIKNRMLPFTQIGCIERPDSQYYLSPVQFLRPAQMELNKAHAQMILGRERFTNFKWWIDGAIQLETDPDDSPSQILRGTSTVPGLKPEILQAQSLPPTQDLDVLEQGMMHIVGQHEVSQAQVPGRVEAAKAIELLKESDAGALATLRKTVSASNSVGWYQALELARAFQKEETMVLAYSREGIPEVKHFRAGAMKPGHRIKTTMTTGLARSRAARQDLLLRMWDTKAISDPEVLADLMEVPLPNMLRQRAGDIRKARNENLTMVKGNAITPGSWEDHGIHLREHNEYRKTSEFDEQPPEVKRKFEFHCRAHEQFQRAELMKQAELAMMMQGQAPPGTQAESTQPQEGGASNGTPS